MILRKAKKELAMLLTVSTAVSLLSGCGGSKSTSSNGDQTSSNTSKTESSQSVGEETKKEEKSEPIDVSIFIPSRLPDALYTTDTMTLKALAEKMNINFDIQTVVSTEAKEKFQVIVASGDMPDVMAGNLYSMNNFGVSGAFLPLNDLIDQYAPNLKQYIIDNKEVLAQTTACDGNIYGIPMLTAVRTALGYCIRQDWLDQLNLKAPVTIDDWYNTLTAFKNNDLNGNGVGDVTPLVLNRAWENYYMMFADAWGIELSGNNDYWMVKDGEMVFAPILPETKEFLATMAKWYQEGLIDQEFITREDTNNYHILNNKGGATCYWVGYVADMNTNAEVLAKDPNTNWQVIAPPVLKEGQEQKTYSQQSIVGYNAWGISSEVDEEKAIELIKMFDYVYSDEGSMLFNFGVEGDSYNVTDGVLDYSETAKSDPNGLVNYIRSNGMQALIGIRQLPEYEKALCSNDDIRRQLFQYVEQGNFYPLNPTLSLSEDDQDAYDSIMSSIKTYVDEELLKFFIGSRPIDEFDSFVQTVKDMRIDEVSKYKNDAYQKYAKLCNE